jgi:hypothetical protein
VIQRTVCEAGELFVAPGGDAAPLLTTAAAAGVREDPHFGGLPSADAEKAAWTARCDRLAAQVCSHPTRRAATGSSNMLHQHAYDRPVLTPQSSSAAAAAAAL